jgi:hypothetical protein
VKAYMSYNFCIIFEAMKLYQTKLTGGTLIEHDLSDYNCIKYLGLSSRQAFFNLQ